MPLRDEDYLILSTIHSAKGREWRAVYVLNVVDGCIPSDMATGSSAEIEEERRVLYVAMTRARDQLHLIHPHRFAVGGQPSLGDRYVHAPRSRFIPDPLLGLFDHRVLGFAAAEAGEGDARPALPRIDVGALAGRHVALSERPPPRPACSHARRLALRAGAPSCRRRRPLPAVAARWPRSLPRRAGRANAPAGRKRPDSIAELALNGAHRGRTAAQGDRAMAKRVLVVDDEPNIVMSLRFLMEREGFHVEVASTGQAAVAALAGPPADLVLLDVMMPGLDGFEVCQRIRAAPAWHAARS